MPFAENDKIAVAVSLVHASSNDCKCVRKSFILA